MFKAIKKWFINQMGGLYEEIMVIKSQQLSLEETLLDHHAEVMARLDDGWCAALDRETLMCTIYERRPAICRDFEMGEHECLTERKEYGLSA